jgi:DNA mismatch repair protein MutS
MKPDKTTPMMAQYMEVKEKYPGYLLMYRLGDFYELFFEDAETASGVLGLAKTVHHASYMGREVPMCGIPHHAFDAYIPRLIKR